MPVDKDLPVPESYFSSEIKMKNIQQLYQVVPRLMKAIHQSGGKATLIEIDLYTGFDKSQEHCLLEISAVTANGTTLSIIDSQRREIARNMIEIEIKGKGNNKTYTIHTNIDTQADQQGNGLGGGLMAMTKDFYPRLIQYLKIPSHQVLEIIQDEAREADAKGNIDIDAERENWSSEWAKALKYSQVKRENAKKILGAMADSYNLEEDKVWVRKYRN